MRAIVCRAYGPPEELELAEMPAPEPGPGEVAIDVAAAGVSYVDGLMIRNLHQNKHALPFAPGMEVAGRVAALGPGVEGLAPGDAVWALVFDGGFAERAIAPAAETFRMPARADFAEMAALSSVYLTAHAALRWEARLAPGERLLVLGAGSGTGLAAVDLGRAMGAEVIAAASTPAKLEAARARGAAHLVCYAEEDLKQQVRAIAGEDGVDVVFDPVAGDLHEPAFRSLGWGGRYVVIGFAGGAVPRVPTNLLLVKNRSALGMALWYYRKRRNDLLRRSADELAGMYAEDRIKPFVSGTLPLARAPEAIRMVMDRQVTGKLVVAIG